MRAAAESGDAASMAKLKAEAERKAAARKAEAERKAAAQKAEAERKAAAQKMEAAREQMSCDAWFELGGCGGGVVGGQQYTSTQCAVQALMIDDQHVLAWLNLGMLMAEQITGDTGGGLVAGQQHSSAQ